MGKSRVHARDILDGREEKHENDPHAKYLDAPAGHVEHEGLHGEGFGWRDGEIPCPFFFQGCVGSGCCLGGCFCLVGVGFGLG